METLIEIFDYNNFNNMVAACSFMPKNLIVLIDSNDNVWGKKKDFEEYVKSFLPRTNLQFIPMDLTEHKPSKEALKKVFESYVGAVVDITGGDTELVFLVGSIADECNVDVIVYKEECNGFVNLVGDYLMDCKPASFTIKNVLGVNGAELAEDGYAFFGDNEITYKEIKDIWSVNLSFYKDWSRFVQWIQHIPMDIKMDNSRLNVELKLKYFLPNGKPLYCDKKILFELDNKGIISNLYYKEDKVYFTFKSLFIKRAIIIAGIWLELYIYVIAKESKYFDDVRVSCVIDWDGLPSRLNDVINEIDVVLVKGVHNTFISCKAREVSNEMINEIAVLAEKLGTQHTKAALVTTYNSDVISRTIYNRADEMGVTLIDRDRLTKYQLLEALKNLVE